MAAYREFFKLIMPKVTKHVEIVSIFRNYQISSDIINEINFNAQKIFRIAKIGIKNAVEVYFGKVSNRQVQNILMIVDKLEMLHMNRYRSQIEKIYNRNGMYLAVCNILSELNQEKLELEFFGNFFLNNIFVLLKTLEKEIRNLHIFHRDAMRTIIPDYHWNI